MGLVSDSRELYPFFLTGDGWLRFEWVSFMKGDDGGLGFKFADCRWGGAGNGRDPCVRGGGGGW